MKTFAEWLESTKHHFIWDQNIEQKPEKDFLGISLLSRPGFRPKEKKYIEQQSTQVEEWLNSITSKYGIHWMILYIEPSEGETDSPEGFDTYKKRSSGLANQKFQDFVREWKPKHPDEKAPNPSNTIVYVKSTSRVHPLSSHQQVHNIAHAVWGYAKTKRAKFTLKLNRIVQKIKKRFEIESLRKVPLNKMESFYNQISNQFSSPLRERPNPKSNNKNIEVSEAEIVVVIARLLNLKSMKRIFSMDKEDWADQRKAINQVYGNWEEFLYEMMAAFFRGKGRINLKPQSDLPSRPDSSAIKAHPSVEAPKEWVWQELFNDSHFWEDLGDELTLIIVESLYDCTYAKVGRPIFATYGGLPLT